MKYRPILIASHPRSGTHLTIDFIRKTFPSTASWRFWGLPLNRLYLNIETLTYKHRRADYALARRILERPDRPLMKTHFLPDFRETWVEEESGGLSTEWRRIIDQAQVIYVSRDPQAVMRSYKALKSQDAHEYEQMSLVEFCESHHWTGEMDRLDWWMRHVSDWLSRPNVTHVRFEQLLRSPKTVAEQMSRLFDEEPRFFENPLPKDQKSVWQQRWSRLTELAPESTAIIPKIKTKSQIETADTDTQNFFQERTGALQERYGIGKRFSPAVQ